MRLKASYGDPPWFVTDLFLKVFAVGIVVAILGLLTAFWLTGPISRVDAIGTCIVTPLGAYLVHLWLAPERSD